MNGRDILATASFAVRSHRLRSTLTVLGIFVGIAAVILSVGIGSGARADVRSQLDELGTDLLVISPGSSTDTSGVRGGFGTASTLTVYDAAAIDDPAAAPDVASVAATVSINASMTYGTTNWTTSLMGASSTWADVRSREVTAGRFLANADDDAAAMVAVIGPDTATELFGDADPVGKAMFYDGRAIDVVGVLDSLDSSSERAANDAVIVPMRTYAQRLVGGTNRDSVSAIYVKATSADALSAAYQEVDRILLASHDITGTGEADFTIATSQSLLSAAGSVDDTMTVMLASIAGISLLVGGIGVMNIMLVSVSERIREIGLRKALGATPSSIRRQFLVEAAILGFAGGVTGVVAGIGSALALRSLADTTIVISPTAAAVAIAMAMAIGATFGVYPASRAARLAPIDALRST